MTRFVQAMLIGLSLLVIPTGSEAGQYALVIGVNHCPNFTLADGTKPLPLRAAESDAQALAALLTDSLQFPATQVLLVTGKQATLAEVRTRFQKLRATLKPGDQFVFYYSGHGTQLKDQKPFDEEDDLDEALCLWDADATGRNLLVDDELGRLLEDLPASAVTVLLDCCHAGTGHKDLADDCRPRFLPCVGQTTDAIQKSPWQDLQPVSKSLDRQTAALFACRPEEQAYERRIRSEDRTEVIRAGQFTHFLRLGLSAARADTNRDGLVSQRELVDYLNLQLQTTFNQDRPEPKDQQHPQLESTRPQAAIFFLSAK